MSFLNNSPLLNLDYSILEFLDDSVFAMNANYEFLAFNQTFSEQYKLFFGEYPKLNERGLGVNHIIFGKIIQNTYERAFQGEHLEITEFVYNQYLTFKIQPVFEANKVKYIIVLIKEFTETVKLEEMVSQYQSKYQYLIDNINDVIFQTDSVGNWIFLNKSWTNIFQYTIEESINKPFYQFLHPEDVEKNELLFEPLINRQKSYCKHIIRYLTKAGSVRWMEVFATLIINEQDQILGTSGTLKDITNEKSNAHIYELLSNNIKDLVCIHSLDGTYLYVSPSIKELAGYEPTELIGRSPYDFFHPDDLNIIQRNHHKTLNDNTNDLYATYRFLKKNGEYIWLETNTRAFFDEYDIANRMITSSREIQERKRVEEGMVKALQKEKELNEIKTRFLAMASHEFKTPLSTIRSSTDIIEAYTLQINDERIRLISNHLAAIQSEVTRLTDLINETLILSKFETERLTVQKEDVDLVKLVKFVADRQNQQQRDGRTVELTIYGKPRTIKLDAQHFVHIIDNLISNAFKYSLERPNPKVSLIFDDETYKITVQDFGIGIPKIEQKKVFSSFFRANNTQDIVGTGLGLSIVQNMVKLSLGTISFESTENYGTVFDISFPY
ncbi:PAS domain-containing sensor histidine kinase [Arcicella aquatica]|uniref:histidine kinase n=1 Tax=Arcicella aquatica TaxID=217141 RepID=A0ABU5QPW7_9BACT|nr:PAS domain-containing sensor histidine kinase [Arcicella aquatica]MEA5259133.1 PAS domain-containing sensor histidine kinase [Arcicella aquatica]